MAITTEDVAARFLNIVADIPLNVTFPVFEDTDVKVVYGKAATPAVLNTDFEVEIAEDYQSFLVTPKDALIDKIDALILADPTNEINYITVRRELDNLTSITEETARSTTFLSREFDRTIMRFQGLAEKLKRAIVLSPAFLAGTQIVLGAPVANAVLKWASDGTTIIPGPTTTEIENAEQNAQDAADSASLAQYLANAVALASTQIQSYVTTIADLLNQLGGAFGEGKDQLFSDTTDYTAGTTTELTLTNTPLPPNEKSMEVYFYGTVGNGVRIASDIYSYDPNTGIITFIVPILAGTTRVMVTWFTSLSIGVPSFNSVSWLLHMVNQSANTIAAYGSDGVAILRAFVTSIAGSPTDIQVPSALAVKTYVDDAVADAIALIPPTTRELVEVVNLAVLGSVSEVVFDGFEEGYDYEVRWTDVATTVTGPMNMRVILDGAGGVPSNASVYNRAAVFGFDYSASVNPANVTGASSWTLTTTAVGAGSAAYTTSGIAKIFNPNATKQGVVMGDLQSISNLSATGQAVSINGGLTYRNNVKVVGVQLFWSGAVFRGQGKLCLYREKTTL